MRQIKTSSVFKNHLISALYRRMGAEHLGQESAAARYGVSRWQMRAALRGKASIEAMLDIADAFGIDSSITVHDGRL